ncbi:MULTISPECIES: ABC transporter substrate-binding protein [Micrococcaceae]|uniref:ABC transporter substrate-binding protein n=1 Tax=Micrococcaceae TaxID=1268 RepID=UPI0017E1C96C|nr:MULTISPECIES: ABC transporter substrate-binding protein [Micrococcaceae]MBB5750248.1 NitT/TauT family transport system substrate-binding protein [Micrococcus sp. TA1]HRO29881.1 ABC transporter substrate-binding protein [Citricoccus sp.]HRO94972.1 ABC transporter substrate-binding protein [Citricoccus sp.]
MGTPSHPTRTPDRPGSWLSRRNLLLTGAAALVTGTAAACGQGEPAGGGATSGAAASGTGSGDGGLRAVSVAAIPIVDVAPLHLAKEQGFFEKAGLDVAIEATSGGAISFPGVSSGQFDFAFGNVVSMMVARSQGIGLKFFCSGSTTTGEPGNDNVALIAAPDSGYTSMTDLAGKTLSSNQLANIGDTACRQVMDKAGGDGGSLEFIEMAFPDVQAALENGQLDAGIVVEPFVTPALKAGMVAVSWPYAEANPELDTGGYFASEETLENDPDLVRSFREALVRGLEYAQDNPDEVRRITGTYATIEPEVLAEIKLPRFRAEFDMAAQEELAETARRYGTVTGELSVPDMFVEL